MKVHEATFDAVKNWPVPKSIKYIRAFFGYCGYYRKLVKCFAKIAAPLNNLLRKKYSFIGITLCQDAFET